ncbi:MAG: GerMN domain-containing protein [Clostridia bacterium]|nr:GerMN domain-containing protein [Clostridia bacterium]
MGRSTRGVCAAALAAALACLSGCSAQVKERPMADIEQWAIEPGCQAPQQDAYAAREESVTLYFLSEDGLRLIPTVRTIEIEESMSSAEAALRALLEGPFTDEEARLGATWPDIGTPNTLRRVQLSGAVATVDLPARVRELPQNQIYALRQAVTNTLTEFAPIVYVNVLVGGREEGFNLRATLPVGTMTRVSDLDVGAQYDRIDEQEQGAQGITRLTTLYFPTADGRMLLPEVRSMVYEAVSPIEYLYTLLRELGKGATGELCAGTIPAPMEYLVEMPEIVRTDDGAYRAIELRLSDRLDGALADAGLTRGVYLAMLTDTLMGFVPGVEGLTVMIGGERLTGLTADETPDGQEIAFEQSLMTRDAFQGYAAAPCALYAEAEETPGKLTRVSRAVAESRQYDPRERLTALMRLSREEGFSALPEALGQEDILAVSIGEDQIALNLSQAFAQALSALTPEQERVGVYAMVNTLTEGTAAQSVVLFFEGEQRKTLAGGLEMRGKLTRNPGMVVR